MKPSQQLRTQQAQAREQAKAIAATATSADRELTAEEGVQIDGLLDTADGLDGKIQEAETKEAADREARLSTAIEVGTRAPAVSGQRVDGVRLRIEDDDNCGFASAGEFYQRAHASFTNPSQTAGDERIRFLAATGMSQGTGADGGMLVPPAFSQTIWDGLNAESDNLLSLCDVYTVPPGADSLTMPANAETSRATGSRFGGVRGYWIAEAAQMTASAPKLRQMKLEPQEMAVLVYVTDKLLRNAPATEQYVTRAATQEIAFLTGDAIINGDGVGKPKGILASGCLVSQAKETGQAADTIMGANIIKMYARCHPRSVARAVWFTNQEAFPQLQQMYVPIGASGQLIYMPPGGISGSAHGTIYNRPVMPIEYAAALGDVGDVILADLGAYAVAVRGGVRSDLSIHLKFDYNETAFRFLFEIDGQPWLASAITPYKAASGQTVSPFVTLAAR